jgi:hypothetical protein
MKESPFLLHIPVAQSGGGTILYTGQTAITFIIHLEERHQDPTDTK